jgi:hypothetical protein
MKGWNRMGTLKSGFWVNNGQSPDLISAYKQKLVEDGIKGLRGHNQSLGSYPHFY